MVPNDIWLRTEWLSCRRTSVLRCVERYCAAAAREYRRALRRVQEVEETMAQVEPETGRRLPSQPAQAELLNRRLAAANAEIRRYQTRLYACEREMVALRQENAELEALCEQARANSLLQKQVINPGRTANGKKRSTTAYYPASQEYGFATKNGGRVPGKHYMRGSMAAGSESYREAMLQAIEKNVDEAWGG